MIVIFVEFAPITIDEKKFAYVESNKNSMLVAHEKNALCDSYIVEFVHDAIEHYLREEHMLVDVLNFLKLCLFCLPMLVDYCSHKLLAHKIPMHRKWVKCKCV